MTLIGHYLTYVVAAFVMLSAALAIVYLYNLFNARKNVNK
jgi:hypothetical protein